MKKKSSIILLFVLAVVTSMCFFACKKDEEPTPDPAPAAASITLDKTSVSLDVYESVVLTANIENVTESLVWSSSNTAVATVDDGKVTAVAAGSATVTVTGSGASATCAVTVTDSHTAPVLRVEHEEIAVALNGTYDLKIETLWKSEALTDIEYVWSVADGQPDDVVSVENIATGARFTGLKYGETVLYVKADVRGTKLVQKIAVKVCNVDITFEVSNLTKGDTYYEANVALIATDTDSASVTPDVKIYDKQVLVDNPEITWTVADETVATVTGGVITALKEGETLVTATYDNNDITLLVKAYRPEIAIADEVTLETSVGTFSITSDLQGTISGVTLGEKDILSSVSDKTFTVAVDKLSKDVTNYGAHKITIETDKARYAVNANIYTKAIKTAEDLIDLLSYTVEVNGNRWGYFVQTQNITITSGRAGFGDWDGEQWVNWFTGVYDGQGYIIDGMTQVTNAGLFGYMADGTVKNIVFTNATLGGNGGLITTELHGGVIENIAVFGKMSSGAEGASWSPNSLIAGKGVGGTIKNCLVELSEHPFSGGSDISAGMIVGTLNATTVQDCIAINLKQGENASIQAIGTSLTGNTDTTTVRTFRSLKEVIAYGKSVDFSEWSTDFWQIIGGMPYPKKVPLPEINVPAVTAPASSGVGADITISGMGEYDAVKLSDVAIGLGVTVEGNIIKVPASITGGTEITFTVYNIFDESKKVDITVNIVASENITVTDRTRFVMADSDDVVFNLSSYEISGNLIELKFGGTAIDLAGVTFAGGTLTVPKSAFGGIKGLYGNKNLAATFEVKSGETVTKVTYANIPVLAVTKVLTTADDILNWQTLAHAQETSLRYWGGYFELGNDIDLSGKEFKGIFDYYSMNSSTTWLPFEGYEGMVFRDGSTGGFRGTFDGCGYTISNLKLTKTTDSFIGQMTSQGVVKNVSFTGVELGGSTALITVGGSGTIENVYAEIAAYSNGSSNDDKTGVFNQKAQSGAKINNCIAVFNCATSANVGFVGMARLTGEGILNGVYGIGIDSSIAIMADGSGSDVYGTFTDYAAMKAAGVTFTDTASEFWAFSGKMPYPKRLTATASIANKVVNIPSTQRAVTVEYAPHAYSTISLDEAAVAAGLTISGNVVNIPEGAAVSSFTVTVKSLINETVKAEKTFYIVSSKTITVTDRTRIETLDSDDVVFDLSEYAVSGDLTEVKIGGAVIDLTNVTFESGKLAMPKSLFGATYGKQDVIVQFEVKSGEVVTELIVVNVPVSVVTKVLKTADDILNWNTLAYAADSAKEYWGGYFELGNDIDMSGKTFNGMFSYSDLFESGKDFGTLEWLNGRSGGFRGTFDGCGYAIKNLTVSKWNDSFVGLLATAGVIKNVSFTNVTLNGGTALIALGGEGKVENVYAEIASYANGNATDKTGVFFARDTMGGTRVNKCFVEFKCETAVTDGFTALGRFHLGYGILNEVYAVGAGLTKDNVIRTLENVGSGDVYGGYESLDAFKAAGVANWENDFWTMVDGVPTPKKLNA